MQPVVYIRMTLEAEGECSMLGRDEKSTMLRSLKQPDNLEDLDVKGRHANFDF